MLAKTINYTIKILMFIIDIILQFLMLFSFPLIWLIAEGNSVKFNQYVKVKSPFLQRCLSKCIYILWGFCGLSIVLFVLFVYNSIHIYTTKIFAFDVTKNISFFIVLITFIVSFIYFTLVISLQRQIINRKMGSVSIYTNFFRLIFIFFFVAILSYPYQLNIKNFVQSEIIIGYHKVDLILELKFPKFHKEYNFLILKNTIVFSVVIIIKISLMYLDSVYLKNKKKEIIKVLSIKQT